MIWIGYTTRYRSGGEDLRAAALTMARHKRAQGHRVRCQAVECKADVVAAWDSLPEPMTELHLFCHSGMYGPMFGTTDLPEQFSPHEWRALTIPMADDGEAFFHACRSGRWFAPFFARTVGVPASGHYWYTTVSMRPDAYVRVSSRRRPGQDVFVIGQPGRTSHGLVGAVGKHTRLLPPEPMLRFTPEPASDAADYDRVATAYDAVFSDIRVRGPEFAWLDARVPTGARVLDIGTGTGALLRAWTDRCPNRVGVDVSPEMLAHARRRDPDGEYRVIDGPTLPFEDNQFDVVTSLLSWRYVDWDPMLAEIIRVLTPGGRLLVVDMVAKAARTRELPLVAVHKLREKRHHRAFPHFAPAREALVNDPAWHEMLRYNPIRAEHEYRWYFESRFPGRTVQTLDVGRRTRVLAFDSGPVTASWLPPQSYP